MTISGLIIYILVVGGILWFAIGRHEWAELERIIAVLSYIETHREEFCRINNVLIHSKDDKGNIKTDNIFTSNMLSVEGKELFVCLSEGEYGMTKNRHLYNRGKRLLLSFENKAGK